MKLIKQSSMRKMTIDGKNNPKPEPEFDLNIIITEDTQMTSKLRIGIYAPSLNESKHVQPWYDSCKNADILCIADTGSTDDTVDKLNALGVNVTSVCIAPFRFDDAFNIAMSLLPADVDICIRLDLDERLQPGWREALENVWKPETTRVRYTYIWNWTADGKPGLQWHGDRIHARKNYRWQGATHEGLCCRTDNEVQVICEDIKIYHYADAKPKKNDLSLLLEAVKEYPHDARIKAYLGREYMYRNMYKESTDTYKEFLGMSFDKAERQQAMCNLAKTDPDNKIYWLKLATIDVPTHREPWVNLAQHYYDIADWQKCLNAAKKALAITINPMDYTCQQESWAEKPHDLLSIAAWNLKLYTESLVHAEEAIKYNPNDTRLKNNLMLIRNYIDNELN
jgi:tetratricopeptide (TPR) repeat protein